MMLYQQRRATDSIIKYVQEYSDAVDEQANSRRTETVHQMTSMYNYQRFQSIAHKESRSAERLRWFILLVIIVSAVSSFAIFLYFSLSKKKREYEYNELVQKYETSLSDYNKLTDDVEKLKSHDEGLLAKKEQETELLREQLQHLRDDLLAIRQQNSILKFENSDIIGKFKEMAKGKNGYSLPTNNDWEELQRQFACQMPLTYAAMGRNNILSFQELNTCILLIAGISNGEIAVLLDSSPQHITNMKKKINKKLFGEVSASSLDMHLRHISGMV
jgi:flagellar basal body-associated protein FliL